MSDHQTTDPMEYVERMAKSAVRPVRRTMGERQLARLPDLNMRAVQSLALAGCSDAQIAGVLGIKLDVFKKIVQRTKGVGMAMDGWRRGGEAAILVTIHHLATRPANQGGPDTDMLKWASINRLGWSNKGSQDDTPAEQKFIVEVRPTLTEEQWQQTFQTGPTIDADPVDQD